MNSILSEIAGRLKPRGSRSRFDINRDTPSYMPAARGRIQQRPSRTNLGLVGRQSRTPSRFTVLRTVDELPPRLVRFINIIVYPKYYKRKGSIMSINRMNTHIESKMTRQHTPFIKQHELLCFLYLNNLSYWYSFKDEKIYIFNHDNENFNNKPIHFKRWIPSFK